MPDDKTKTCGQDRSRISLSEDYEVRDWAAKFGVSAEQLKAAGGRQRCQGRGSAPQGLRPLM